MPEARPLARALGWFSLGLGTAQIVAPRAIHRLIGIKTNPLSETLVRFVGVREIGAGVGLLTQQRSPVWLWARVAGDAMDLTLLGRAALNPHNHRSRVTSALAAVSGVAAADVRAALQTRQDDAGDEGNDSQDAGAQDLVKAITIRRPVQDVYAFWRDFRNLPKFTSHLHSVAVLDSRRSHWTARGPAGRLVEWDAEITEDRPDEVIAWRSLPSAQVPNSGEVRFSPAPGGRGTELRIKMQYSPPGGVLGSSVARLFGQEPKQQVQSDLRKLKQVLEVGEPTLSFATLTGTDVFQGPGQPRPASSPTGVRA